MKRWIDSGLERISRLRLAAGGVVARTVGDELRAAPEPVVYIEPPRGWPSLDLEEAWRYRNVVSLLVVRDTKVRYRQTLVGVIWALIQPLMTMVIFTVLFHRMTKMPSGSAPYPLFSLCALVPWTYFVHALTKASTSLVNNQSLIRKVYFPRVVIPIASIVAALVDFAIAFTLLVGMLAAYGVLPGWSVLLLPFFVLLAIFAALAFGLWLSAIYVQYRDVVNVLPFLMQAWLFLTPVAYTMQAIPSHWKALYSLNPMASVVAGFRWALLGDDYAPGLPYVVLSTSVVVVLFVGGLYFFRWQEERFADVI